MKKFLISVLFSCLFLFGKANAADQVLSGLAPLEPQGSFTGFAEVGEKSTISEYESEDQDLVYKYQKYFVKWEQKASDKLNYDFSAQVYDKDYQDSDRLDNHSYIFKGSLDYLAKKDDSQSLGFGLDMKYQAKRYPDSPINEFNQVEVLPGMKYVKKDDYQIDLSLGLNDYDYPSAHQKNQRSFLTALGGKKLFLDQKLQLSADYRIDTANRAVINRRKTKQDASAGLDYKFDLSWIEKLTGKFTYAKRDTRGEDDRDDDFDYTYRQAYVKTSHKINPSLDTTLKYQYFSRDYLGTDLDSKGYLVANRYEYSLFKDKIQKAWMTSGLEYKKTDFKFLDGQDFKRYGLDVDLNYQRTKNWQITCGWEGDSYNYLDNTLDKQLDYFLIGAKKWLKDGDFALTLDYKTTFTNNRSKPDSIYQSVRLGFSCIM